MIALLSPAKSLDFETKPHISDFTLPNHLEKSEYLINKFKKLSARQIGNLMSVSPALSDLNYERFQSWHLPFNEDNAKQACLAFTGAAYQGWDAPSMTKEDLNFAQDHVRILSGLYGMLRPLDLIQPYRMEMGTSYKVTPKVKNLYLFWKELLTERLNKELAADDGICINVASNEYFKAIDTKKINGRIITCHFKEFKNGEYKTIMTFAKKARGLMIRHLSQNKLITPEELKTFNLENYEYNEALSTENDWMFVR